MRIHLLGAAAECGDISAQQRERERADRREDAEPAADRRRDGQHGHALFGRQFVQHAFLRIGDGDHAAAGVDLYGFLEFLVAGEERGHRLQRAA